MNKYLLKDVWVSEELASELIDSNGCISDVSMKYSNGVMPSSYLWHIPTHTVYRHPNTLTTDEDDLARVLLLINNVEARLEYLNNH